MIKTRLGNGLNLSFGQLMLASPHGTHMARTISITAALDDFTKIVTKALQSGHINFLLGSGASLPAIQVAGTIEAELDTLLASGDPAFNTKRHEFLSGIQESANKLISGTAIASNTTTLDNYRAFLLLVSRILEERKTTLLPHQATVFSTNYDLFVERASEDIINLRLNDGFVRNPSVQSSHAFHSEHYFDVTYKTGALFRHTFPIPTINLIKLHGSLSWKIDGENILYSAAVRALPDPASATLAADIEAFANRFALIFPTKEKYRETLLTRVYYDLLRIFANTLEVENTTLICFGFSFNDAHIRDIVTRGLKNPTLLVVILAYSEASVAAYEDFFKRHNNVIIVHATGAERIDFPRFHTLIEAAIPKSHEA